jgi:hypothetical protein
MFMEAGFTRGNENSKGSGLRRDSAEKPRSPFDKAQGEREINIDDTEDFPFVLRLSKHERGFFSRIKRRA